MNFDELKARIESSEPTVRQQGLDDFVRHYLSESNPVLRTIASRAILDQLRPMFTIEDVVSMAMQKVRRRLQDGRLQLRSERQFLAYVTYTVRKIVLDLIRQRRLPIVEGDPRDLHAEKSDQGCGPRTLFMEKEANALLLNLLDELLTTEEMYLIRRHYFEGANYDELASELLRPTPGQEQGRGNVIRMRINRIREKLKERDEELMPFLVD